ncbi:MAG: VanZ family protein, partial [Planctomycetota bacterium]
GLVWLVFIAGRRRPGRWLVLAAVLLSLHGVLDELTQALIPDRYADFYDWLCDTTGATIGMLVGSWLDRRFFNQRTTD